VPRVSTVRPSSREVVVRYIVRKAGGPRKSLTGSGYTVFRLQVATTEEGARMNPIAAVISIDDVHNDKGSRASHH